MRSAVGLITDSCVQGSDWRCPSFQDNIYECYTLCDASDIQAAYQDYQHVSSHIRDIEVAVTVHGPRTLKLGRP